MEKPMSELSTQELISAALSKVRTGQPTREQALVITKLQEAMMWQAEYENVLKTIARRTGVGASVRQNNPNAFAGVVLTEPIEGINIPHSTPQTPLGHDGSPATGETSG
jgi:hypothetical protein